MRGGQHELEVGTVVDIGPDRPARAGDGLDTGQADGDGEAVEVDVGVVQAEAGPAVLEHAEHEPPPALGMERAVEEGAALDRLAAGRGAGHVLEHHGQRIVTGGGLDGPANGDGVLGFRGLEGDGGAVGPGRAIVGLDLGVGLPEKMSGREFDPPSGRGRAVRGPGPGGDGASAPREAEEPHAGRVLAAHQILAPAVLAEREQDGRVGDTGAVVGHGHGGTALGAGAADRDADTVGAGATGVLEGLGEDVREAGGIHPGDAFDGAVMDAGADWRRELGGNAGRWSHAVSP